MSLNYGTPGGFGSSRDSSSSMSGPEPSSPSGPSGRGQSPGSYGDQSSQGNRDSSTFRGNSKRYREQRIRDHHRRYLESIKRDRDSAEEQRRREEAARREAARLEATRQAAVGSRNTAVNTMLDAITTAFADKYNTEYYGDRTTAFNAFANPLLTSGYDDALRGIYEGFREAGIFDTDAFNTQKGKLDTAKTTETTRLGTLAKAYNQRVKDAVTSAKTGVTGDFSKLYGDDTVSAEEAAAQQTAVEGFTYDTDITTPEFTREDDPDTEDVDETISAPVFFQNFRKLSDQGVQTAPNQAASGRTPQAAASGRMSTRNFNFQNPVSQGSSRIIG